MSAEILAELERIKHERADTVRSFHRRYSRKRLQALMGEVGAAILVDPDLVIYMATQMFERLVDYPPSELQGESIKRLIPTRFHETHDIQTANFLKDPHTLSMMRQPLPILRRDGTERLVRIEIEPCKLDTDRYFVARFYDEQGEE